MSNPGDADTTPITGTQELADYLAAGCKPPSAYSIGTEHEAFGFHLDTLAPPAYETVGGKPGIKALLRVIEDLEHQTPILDNGNIIGLKSGGASLSLEPGGQFELSGGMFTTLHETKAELDKHIARLKRLGPALGLGFMPLGFHPTATRAQMPFMPKGRYKIMRDYMPKVGSLGLDMMLRTCTVQVNLDFSSEQDMITKMRVAATLQPLATAMFANSPFMEGRPTGFLSNRAQVWTDTDKARAGIPAIFFSRSFGFEAYVEWLLDVPMYFVYRDGIYHDVAGASFRDFMGGRLPGELAGVHATLGDFADHMTTAFPDVRLKRYIETRGADSGSPAMMLAQSAFWTGIFYDPASLAAAAELAANISYEKTLALRAEVPKLGIHTPFRDGTLRSLARDAVVIADQGLRARGNINAEGLDERVYLSPLHHIAAGAPTQAEHWLSHYHNKWDRNITKIFDEAAF
ncbi:MAG: glutamate--cysteine ligase [Acidocella sp. 20-61-6]|nr:MAG: glutamate--cysteine ligase [Acidocella sp. 20-61-6]